jgi:hypothetical protein
MAQETIILLLFVAAAGFVARLVYQQFFARRAEKGCAKGCGSCSAIDVEKIKVEKIKKEAHAASASFRSSPEK